MAAKCVRWKGNWIEENRNETADPLNASYGFVRRCLADWAYARRGDCDSAESETLYNLIGDTRSLQEDASLPLDQEGRCGKNKALPRLRAIPRLSLGTD
jgi:hypothetical protein